MENNPHSTQVNVWRILEKVVETRDNLVRGGVVLESSICVMYGEEGDGIPFVFQL